MRKNTLRPMTFQPSIYEKVVQLLPDDPRSRVLDIGAGEGYFSRRLKDLGFAVDACDFLPENFKCSDIRFIKANLNEHIPCEDNKYDLVVSIEVIEHIENHFKFMSEVIRITRPNGLVLITTPNVLSLPSRWHFFLYGFTDCAPAPLDPNRTDYFMEHINPISLPELLFHFERCGADLVTVTTNRIRRSSWVPVLVLYPLLALAIRCKLLRKKHRSSRDLYRRHIRWMLSPANLMGRITIAVAKKRM